MCSSNTHQVEVGAATLAFGNDEHEKLPLGSYFSPRFGADSSVDAQ